MSLYVALFLAGTLTILLPCILPLLPIVLGVSITGHHPLRPLFTVLGMSLSFVIFTLLLNLVLSQFVEAADIIRIGTNYALLLFGAAFLFRQRLARQAVAIVGSLFFLAKGGVVAIVAMMVGIAALEIASRVGGKIQQAGADVQQGVRSAFGESLLAAFLIGTTLGLVWVPCAGPALGFVFALLRLSPTADAAFSLIAYVLGSAVPLLLIGYGGQRAVHSVRAIAPYTGRIKQCAGALLLITAVGLHFHWFEKAQIWLLDHTTIGDIGTQLENRYFGKTFEDAQRALYSSSMASTALKPMPSSKAASSAASESLPQLAKGERAPELVGLGEWFNSKPLTMAGLKGKVVLVDFWTYSCINCIRTLPYIKQYWEAYKDTGKFVIIGVHAPEFVFEKSADNVRDAVKRYDLTYPVAQDNNFDTWKAFANRYWPAKYLIDAEGYFRYTHFGEGDYGETDQAIRSLLVEAGVDLSKPTAIEADAPGRRMPLSSETYVGERSWQALQNALGDPDDSAHDYTAGGATELHHFQLDGTWQLMNGERQVLRSDSGSIRMRFLGGEMNLVLGLEDGAKAAQGSITIDGKPTKTITIDRDDLYNLYDGPYGEHEMVLTLQGKGVESYAFTFGTGE